MKSSDRSGIPPGWDHLPPEDLELLRARAAEQAFAQTLQSRRPYASYVLIAACVVVYLGQLAMPGVLEGYGVNQGDAVRQGQVWRLVSCMFLHDPRSLLHIGSNMFALYSIGPFLERVLGSARLTVLYLVSGLGGSIAGGMIHPHTTSLGASGAIWGLMGGALALALLPRGLLPSARATFLRRALVQTLLVNLGISLLPMVDGVAHLGGGAAGFVLLLSGAGTFGARPAYLGQPESPASRIPWAILSAASWLVMLAGVGVMVGAALFIGAPASR